MKIEQKSKPTGHGARVSAGLAGLVALGLGISAENVAAQQYQSTYGSSGGSVVIDPNVLNSMGGPAVTTQGTAIIPIPGTATTLLAPPPSTPQSRLLVSGAGGAPARAGTAPAPASEPASQLLVAPATRGPGNATLQPRQPTPQTAPQPQPKVASVGDETPPPPKPTTLKEAEPVAPEPMATEAPKPPARATAVEDSDQAATAAAPQAAPESAPAPKPAQPETTAAVPAPAPEPATPARPQAAETPREPAEPSEPELPQTPSVAQPTAPAPAPETNGTAENRQTASLPPAGDKIDERLVFGAEQDEIDDEMRAQLNTIAETLLGDEARRIELRGYADAVGDNAASARRISLKRAVSVRRYLMDQGVRSTRIDVRALGDKEEDAGPTDRVDLIFSQ